MTLPGRFGRTTEKTGIRLEPLTLEHLEVAREAWRRFGKGKHAVLKCGNCFAYALADVLR